MESRLKVSDIEDNIEVARYCNGEGYNEVELSKGLGNIGIGLSNIVVERYKGYGIDYINIGYGIRDRGCIIEIRYKIGDLEGKEEYKVKQEGYDRYKEELVDILNIIVEGSKVISELNKDINEIQGRDGSSVMVQYKLGVQERVTKVEDWDYDRVTVVIGRVGVLKLIELKSDDGRYKGVLVGDNWNMTLVGYIRGFNSIGIHKELGIELVCSSVEGNLMYNMVSLDDLIKLIKVTRGNVRQEVKVVTVINELGKFIVISKWDIDYNRSEIGMDVRSVIDIERDKVIYDSAIIEMVRDKISITERIKEEILGRRR